VADSFGVLDTDNGSVDIPNTLENVSIYNNVGDVDILSLSDFTIEGMNSSYTVYAGGSVDIQSDGTLNLGEANTVGRLDNGHDVAILAGGNVTLSAGLTAGGDLNAEDTEIIAGANVNITSGDVLVLNSVNNVSDTGGIDIEDSDIYAGNNGSLGVASFTGGSVNINDLNGSVTLFSDTIHAYSGHVSLGDVNIYGSGTLDAKDISVDLEDTYIYASGDVDVEGGDSVTLGGESDGEVNAGGSISIKADTGDVYVDYGLFAGGDVSIISGEATPVSIGSPTTGGNIDVEDSDLYAGDNGSFGQPSTTGGSVNIYAYNGNVTLNSDGIYAYSGESSDGDVNVTAGGYADIEYSDVNQDGSVSANAGDYVKLYDIFNDRYDDNSSDTYLSDWNITAGSYVEIDADANVQIYNSDIYAGNGDVDINSFGPVELAGDSIVSDGGDITIGSSSIEAWDSVNVTANDGSVCIYGGSSLYADNGDVNITAYSGGIDTYNSTIAANGSVYLSADGDVFISDSPISATAGNSPKGETTSGDKVSISSGGELTVNGTFGDNDYGYDIGADSKICLWGADGVSIDDALIETLDGNACDKIGITADGEIDIAGGSELYSDGSVKVEAYDGNVNILNSKITANGGDVYVSSDDGMLTVNAGHSFENVDSLADTGADINAEGTVTLDGDCVKIKDTAIYAGDEVDITGEDGSVNIKDADIETGSGDVNITAYNGNLTLDSGCADYGVYIEAGGYVNLYADSDVNIYDSEIYADDGDVTINSGEDLNLGDGNLEDGVYIEAAGGVTMTAGGDADIFDSSIFADGGDVTISAVDTLTIGGGNNYNSISGNNVSLSAQNDGVHISDESMTAVNGDLTINAGSDNEDLGSVRKIARQFVPGDSVAGFAIFTPADQVVSQPDIDEEGTTLTDPGSIDLIATDTATVNNSTLTAEGGHIGISGDGAIAITGSSVYADAGYADITSSGSTVDIDNSYIYASGDVNIEGGGALTLQDDSTIESYGANGVSLKSDNADVDVNGSSVSAYDGNVSISALNLPGVGDSAYPGAAVDIEDTYIYANGDVNVESSGTLTVGTSSGWTIDANGAVNLTSDYGDVDVDNYYIYAYGENGVNISAFGGIDMENDYDVEAYNDSVSLNANGNVYLNNDDVYADNGSVGVQSGYSGVDIENSYIYASANVNVEGWGTVTLGDSSGDTIDAYGSAYLTSDCGDVDVYDNTYINAYNGGVNIYANYGNVDVEDSHINANSGNNVDISGSSLSATGDVNVNAYSGYVDIHAAGNVYISDTTISLGGDVSTDDSSVTAGAGDAGTGSLNIATGSELSISGDYVSLYSDDIEGNNISISDGSSLTANNGDVNIDNYGSVTISWNSGNDTFGNYLYVNNISISDSTITANNGNIYIKNYGDLNVPYFGEDSDVTANEISISDSTIAANSGNVAISTSGGIDINSSVISATVGIQPVGETISSGDSISIAAGGTASVNGEYGENEFGYDIGADSSVCIWGGNDVDINNAWIQTLDGSVADTVGISSGGDVTVDNSFILSFGDLSVKSGGMLTVDAGHDFGLIELSEFVNDFDIYAGGNLSLDGGSGASIVDTAIYAGSEVDITGDNGDVLVEDADIETSGGNVNIAAKYGDLTLDSGSAEYGVTINAGGDVNLTADGNISISDANINGNDVNINAEISNDSIEPATRHSGHFTPFNFSSKPVLNAKIGTGFAIINPADQTISQSDIDEESTTINDPGSIDLIAVDTVTVNNSTLAADGGHLGVSGGGIINISGSSIYAYGGDATITSSGGTVDVEGTLIAANGNVIVDSSDTLTFGNSSGDTIEAINGVTLTSDTSEVNVYESDIYAYGGDVDITASLGAVDIEDNSIYAYNGGINISASGDAYFDYNDIYAYGGDIVISSSDNTVEIYNSYLYASGDVQVTSEGMLTVNAGHDFNSSFYEDIYAGDSVTLDGGSCAAVVDTAIYAQNNVAITGDDGNVLVEDADIETGAGDVTISATSGNLTLDSGDAEYGVYIEAGGSVNLSADSGVNIFDSSIYSDGGDVNVTAYGGNVDMENSDAEASGSLNIMSEGNVTLPELDSISSGADVDVFDSSLTADNGSVNIHSFYGGVDVEDTSINAGSDVNIETGYFFSSLMPIILSDDSITARGSVGVWATGDVSIFDSEISAYDGTVNIYSYDGNVDIESTAINSGSSRNVDISGETWINAGQNVNISAEGGTVNINAANNLTMINSEIDLGGDISVSGSTIAAQGGDINITTGGALSVSGGGTVNISGTSVSGDNIFISGSTITANNGNVTIANNNSLSLPDGAGFDLSSANNIDVSGSTITASGSTGTVELDNTSGKTTVENGSSIDSFYLNVNSSDGILIDGTGGGHISGNTMNLAAGIGNSSDDVSGGHTVTVQNEDLTSFQTVNVTGHTVNLDGVTFANGSVGNFTSFHGGFYVNDGHQAGYVNFNNDFYGNQAITTSTPGVVNTVDNGLIDLVSTPSSSAGLHVVTGP